jgi:hypothetical protein
MPEESPPIPGWRRLLAGVASGAAAASAAVAVVGPVVMWAIRSPSDVTTWRSTEVGIAAMITGAVVILVLTPRLIGRSRTWPVAITLTGLLAAGICAWVTWRVAGSSRTREAWPFVDSTGASILGMAAGLGAMLAVLLALAAAVIGRPIQRTAALCTFLVAAVAVTALTYQTLQEHRSGVWRPDLTATSATPLAVPDAVGPVRYSLSPDDRPDIYAAGNGFVVDTGREITAYDGPTGEKRWHATDYGTSGRVMVVRRDRDDAAGIVVAFLFHGIVAFDGSSGEVLWRRQYSSGGTVTAATGSVDALGMAVFTADATVTGGDSRTRLHSLDPATGRERWSQPIECSNPTLSPGISGQFSYACGKPSLIDARTGAFIEVPGKHAPTAGTDLYVTSFTQWDDRGPATEETIVINPDGRVVDEIHDAQPISPERNGFFAFHDGKRLLMRDSRAHRSTPLPITDIPVSDGWPPSAWLNDQLLIAAEGRDHPLYLVNPAKPAEKPATTASPCPRDDGLYDLYAVAGAVLAECGRTKVVGLVP